MENDKAKNEIYWYNPFVKTVLGENLRKDYLLGVFLLKQEKIDYSFPVDIVFCWVDGSDVEWTKKKNYWKNKNNNELDEQAVNDGRFVDNEELKFALRSVEKNIPWINKIYIITDNQIPKWIILIMKKYR